MAERRLGGAAISGILCMVVAGCASTTHRVPNGTIPAPQQSTPNESEPNAAIPPSAKASIPAHAIEAAARTAYARGIEWVLSNQRPSGAWGSFESVRRSEIFLDTQASHLAFQSATTALVAWALIAPSHDDARCRTALERGLTFLSSRPAPGRATGKTFYSIWAHTYFLELAAAILADDSLKSFHEPWSALMARELLLVRREQGTEGGWGYYDFTYQGMNPSGNQSTSFNTAAMILAMKAAEAQGGSVPAGTFEDATRALVRMHLPSGTFAYGTYAQLSPRANYNKVSGSSGRLQACNVALAAVGAGGVTAETLARGLQHLRNTHQYIEIGRGRTWPHEAFYQTSGYYYYFGHYYAACALELLQPSAERAELARWLAEVMVHDQNPDGSWFDYPLYGYGRAYGTGFALLTLEKLKVLLHPASGE